MSYILIDQESKKEMPLDESSFNGSHYLCPFHSDAEQSLSASPPNGTMRCWACGAHGFVREDYINAEFHNNRRKGKENPVSNALCNSSNLGYDFLKEDKEDVPVKNNKYLISSVLSKLGMSDSLDCITPSMFGVEPSSEPEIETETEPEPETEPETEPESKSKEVGVVDWGNLIRSHTYKDIHGVKISQKRYYGYKNKEGKTPIQYRWENNDWIPKLTYSDGTKVPRILYNSHLFTGNYTKPIYITEGEKDSDTLVSKGKLATTLGGSQMIITGIHKKYLLLRDTITLVGDCDKAGAQFVAKTVSVLINMGYPISNIKYIKIDNPNNIKKYDISDVVDEGTVYKVLDIFDNEVLLELKKYEVFLDDVISPMYWFRNSKVIDKEIFEPDVKELLENIARVSCTSLSNTIATFLPIVSYLVCDKYRIKHLGLETSATISSCIIGNSGSGKSNAMKTLIGYLESLNKCFSAQYETQMNTYNLDKEYRKTNDGKASVANGTHTKVPLPRRSYAFLTKATLPALKVQLMIDNKIIYFKDELNSVIKGLDEYKNGGGSDLPELIGIMDNSCVAETTKSGTPDEKHTNIPYPLMPIFGCMTWKNAEFFKLAAECGFSYRWIFSVISPDPNDRPKYNPIGNNEFALVQETETQFFEMFEALKNLIPFEGNAWIQNPETSSRKLHFSSEAAVRWTQFSVNDLTYLEGIFYKDGKDITGLVAKARPTTLKLILLLHLINNRNNQEGANGDIQLRTVEQGISLSKYYMFQGYKIFVDREASENKRTDIDFIKIKRWFQKKEISQITMSSLQRSLYRQLPPKNLFSKLQELEKKGYLRLQKKGKSITIKLN